MGKSVLDSLYQREYHNMFLGEEMPEFFTNMAPLVLGAYWTVCSISGPI